MSKTLLELPVTKNSQEEIELECCWVSDFTEEKAVKFHEDINDLFKRDPQRPITIHINSYGGEVDALFSMLDSMDAIRSMAPPDFKFITVAKGKAISAGAVLLSYGDIRFAEPNSRIMLHQVIGGSWGSKKELDVEFEEIGRLNDKLLTILKKKCKFPIDIKEFKELLSHNLYLTPEKAHAFGLIDVIGSPKVLEHKFYELRVLNGSIPKGAKNANRRANKNSSKNKG